MISNILKKFHDIRYLNVTDLFNITSKYLVTGMNISIISTVL